MLDGNGDTPERIGVELERWLDSSREQQGADQGIWDVLSPRLRDRGTKLRNDLFQKLHIDKNTENGPQTLRVALLKGLLVATGSQADDDDVEILDETLVDGGVGIGIEEPIKKTGW